MFARTRRHNMSLNLVRADSVEMPSKGELTPQSNLKTIQNTLKNFLAHHFNTGIKISTNQPRNLIVNRSNGRNLAIKISNHTWNLIPLEDEKEIEQIQNVIKELPEYVDSLYSFKLWCNQITGVKDGATKYPRPEASF